MYNPFSNILVCLREFIFGGVAPVRIFPASWSDVLMRDIDFYRMLTSLERQDFEQRILLFLDTTRIESGQFTITDQDRLLVAASAIIPVWKFPKWHYVNLAAVYLLPGAFNQNIELGQADSTIIGMVGNGVMAGKLVLSRPHLINGFVNNNDKQNVGIHEFVHLIDMADGDTDGFPERLKSYSFSLPWFDFIDYKIKQILNKKSNISEYGATNRQEFFAVACEYFFERPVMLKRKHPKLYSQLSDFFKQDVAAIKMDIRKRERSPCLCGSGKRYKRCCMPKA